VAGGKLVVTGSLSALHSGLGLGVGYAGVPVAVATAVVLDTVSVGTASVAADVAVAVAAAKGLAAAGEVDVEVAGIVDEQAAITSTNVIVTKNNTFRIIISSFPTPQ